MCAAPPLGQMASRTLGAPAGHRRFASLTSPALVDIAGALARARMEVDSSADPGLASMLTAAEELAAQWRDRQELVDRCRLALEHSMIAESEARWRLDVALLALSQLAPGPSLLALEGDATGQRARVADSHGHIPHDAAQEPHPPPGAADAAISVCLLGRFRLFLRGRAIQVWPGSKTQRIARYLFGQHGRVAPRDQLIEWFWPDVDLETGRRNLHQAIYSIRKALRSGDEDEQIVVYANDAYSISTDRGLWSDVAAFESHANAGRAAERDGRIPEALESYSIAEETYTGDFLEDTPYEEWTQVERDRLRLLYIDIACRLADLALACGDVERSLDVSRRILRREPCDEASHRRALRCYAALGNRSQIMQQYSVCREALASRLGLEPARETAQLYDSLLSA